MKTSYGDVFFPLPLPFALFREANGFETSVVRSAVATRFQTEKARRFPASPFSLCREFFIESFSG